MGSTIPFEGNYENNLRHGMICLVRKRRQIFKARDSWTPFAGGDRSIT
jgi:hypothetical protein